MSDSQKRRKAKQARRDARRMRSGQRPQSEDFDLLDAVREALASGHPMEMLFLVSTIIEATAPRHPFLSAPFDSDEPELVDIGTLIDGFIGVTVPETTALLLVLSEMIDDAAISQRCRRAIAERHDELPQWITELGQAHVDRVVRMTDALGEGDELMLGVVLPSQHDLTCAVYLDHTATSEIADAFFVPNSLQEVLDVAQRSRTDPDTSFVEMSLADARAWLRGVEVAGVTLLPEQSDTWPAGRPMLAWLTRQLPDGGSGYQR